VKPEIDWLYETRCDRCGRAATTVYVVGTRTDPLGSEPVLVRYRCLSGCAPAHAERRRDDADPRKRAFFERYDLGKLREIDARPMRNEVPPHRMMTVPAAARRWGAEWRKGRDSRTLADLYTKRTLWALGAIRARLGDAGHLRLAFSSIVLHASRLYRHRS